MICVFKCPHCGAKMRFSPETQNLICDTCCSEMPVWEYDEDSITYEGAVSVDNNNIRKMECPECGANIYTEDNNATLKCGYCGSELAALAIDPGDMMPEKIIPLSITEKQALDHVIGWWMHHESMPPLDIHKMKMEFHDIYIPVWLYDIDTVTSVQALVNHDNVAVNMDILADNYKKRSERKPREKTYYDYVRANNMRKYEFSGNNIYRQASQTIAGISSGRDDFAIPGMFMDNMKSTSSVVFKSLESSFQKIPNVASSHFSSERFRGIEPYNYYGLKSFKSVYLSGHQAENYEFKHDELMGYVTRRIKKYALEQCYTHVAGTVPGGEIAHVMNEKSSSYPENVYYALVPLWICTYYYAGKKHFLYINGQTGKTDGDIIFAKKTYDLEVTLYSLAAIFCFLMLTQFTAVLLFDFANALVYVTYLAILAVMNFGSKKDKWGLDMLTYMEEKKIVPKRAILTKLGVGVGLFVLNALMFFEGFYNFDIITDNMFISYILSFIIAGISITKFALKRRKDLLARDEVEYRDYILEAGTRVLASTRS